MAKNSNLHAAKVAKNDEFYTRYEDIEKEIYNYRKYFEGKTVLCNCDDPMESNFTKYFILNFRFLKLKRLICTFYDINGKRAYVFVYDGQDINGDGIINEADIQEMVKMKAFRHALMDDFGFDFSNKEESWAKGLYGSGDFRSQHCIEYLKRADVVVTNPPFSLFKEYVAQLIEYRKKFIIIGFGTAIAYKEIFPYIKKDQLWLGITKISQYKTRDGNTAGVFSYWYTNVEHKKHNTPLDLYKMYSNEYKHYGNLDAIDVPNVSDIPLDYDGMMGVPVSFLEDFCPNQFEIVGNANIKECLIEMGATKIGEENIEKMKMQGLKRHITKNSYDLFTFDNGIYHNIFSRIIIRKRNA